MALLLALTSCSGWTHEPAPKGLAGEQTVLLSDPSQATSSPATVSAVQASHIRQRLMRDMRGTGIVLSDLHTAPERSDSAIDGMTLDEALAHSQWDFHLAPEDDVY